MSLSPNRAFLGERIAPFAALVLLGLLTTCPATAATFYVNNSGSPACSNSPTNGSATSPWCTLDYGVTRIASGDTLYVRSGTYTIANGFLLIAGPSGTSGAHTVISAYPGDTVNLLPSDSSTKLVFGGLSSCTPVSYMDFSGFRMYSSGGNTWETAVTVNCSSHITLSNLTVHDTGQEGIHIFGNSTYVTLSNSTIYNTGTGSLDGEGVYVGSSTSVSTVDNTNTVTISGNTIHNTKDEGIELKPGTHDCIVDGNTLYSNNTEGGGYGGAAIEVNEAVASPQHWDSNPNHIIRNNVVHDTGVAGASALYNTAIRLGTGSLAYNNIIYSVTSPGYGIYLTNGEFGNTDTYTRGVYHNTIDMSSNATGSSGSPTVDVRNNIGPTGSYNTATSSSLYVSQATHNYHLSATATAAHDKGADLTATVPADIEGTSRSVNSPPDLGAYEFVNAPDTTPPSVPTGLSATALSASSIGLTWTASTDNVGVTGYRVYRGGNQIGTPTTNSYTDTGLAASTSYSYTVAAYDAAGNASGQSVSVQASTPASGGTDTIPPSVPTSVSASAVSASSIAVAWAASTDNVGVTGYRIYRGGVSIGTSATTSYSDTGLAASTQYSYTVAAYDAAGNVSGQSATVRATTSSSGGTTISAASCSQTDVQTAINAATDGSTVVVPACSSTSWGKVVNVNKGITLQGQTTCTGKAATLACTDATIISAGVDSALTISASNARVTGLTINGGSGTTAVNVDQELSGWRLDHIHIGPSTGVRGIYVYGGSGLIDHVYIETRNGGVDVEGLHSTDVYPGDYNWSHPLSLGSSDAVYIEDSRFVWTSQTDGGYDLYNGAKVVFRFNALEGATIGDHGLDSSAGRATLLQEIYNNTSSAKSFDTYTFWNTRGGTQLIFNNTTSGWGQFADIRVYRSDSGYGWGNGNTCVSNSNWIDGNTGHGYPCRDQVGRGPETAPANDWPVKTTTAVYSEKLMPTYLWANTINGSAPAYASDGSGAITVSNAANASMPNDASKYHALPNQDFYNQTASFNGTVGVGSGTLASRPGTCTAGVAYWAADQGSWNQSGSGGQGVLYQCSATNTWSAYYTPYTYPHPQQGGSQPPPVPPNAPTTFTTTVH